MLQFVHLVYDTDTWLHLITFIFLSVIDYEVL